MSQEIPLHIFSGPHIPEVNPEARKLFWRTCQVSNSIGMNRRHLGIRYLNESTVQTQGHQIAYCLWYIETMTT